MTALRAIVKFTLDNGLDVFDYGLTFFERGHFGIDIELYHLNNMLLILKRIANQRQQSMFGIIIQLWHNLQHQHNQVQRVIGLVGKVQ